MKVEIEAWKRHKGRLYEAQTAYILQSRDTMKDLTLHKLLERF